MHDENQLLLRADYSIIPRGPHEAYLYLEGGTSIHLACKDIDVSALTAALLNGATMESLEAYGAAGADKAVVRHVVRALVAKLRSEGALQREVSADGLSAEELSRFRTHLAYFSRFETEQASRFDFLRRVRGAHVLLLGLGGLGSSALMYLVGAGVGRITGVDPDVLEASNLGRQVFFAEGDVGRKKVVAAASAVARLSSHTRFVGVDQEIGAAAHIEELIREHGPVDLIVQAADRPIWDLTMQIAAASLATSIPALHASYLGVGPLLLPGVSACPACILPRVEAQIPNAQEIVAFHQRLDAQSPPRAVLPTSLGEFGVHMAQEAVMFLAGAGAPRTVNALLRLAINGHSAIEELPPDPRCRVCHGSGAAARR